MSTQNTTNNNATNAKEQDMNTQDTTTNAPSSTNTKAQDLGTVAQRLADILKAGGASLSGYRLGDGVYSLSEGFGLNEADRALINFGQDMSDVAFNEVNEGGNFEDLDMYEGLASFAGSVYLTGAAMVASEIRQGFALVAATLAEVSDARQFTSAPGAADIAKHPSAHYGHALNATAANEG